MDISSNPTAEHCCLCLEENDIKSCCFKDKIRHIPCKCNIYCHKYCFNKTPKTHCMVCKQKYILSWGEDPNNIKKPTYCEKMKKKIKKKYIGGKISLQKQNRKLENCVIKVLNALHYPDFGNCCLDICAGLSYSIIVLVFLITGIMSALMVGGYYLNIILCSVFGLWEAENFCLLSTNDGLLYLLGVFGFPLLLANITCFYVCCGPLCMTNKYTNPRIFPGGII